MNGAGLFVILPPEVEPAAAIPRLSAALESGAVAAVLVQRASDAPELWREALLHLLPVIRRYDVALLLENQPELAVAHDCDGVQIDAVSALGKTRAIVGPDRHLGMVCHDSRHLAMEAGEAGVDYVAFAPIPELLGWWSAMMTLPCVSLPAADAALIPAILASGVEFLGLGGGFWADARSNEAVMAELLALLALA